MNRGGNHRRLAQPQESVEEGLQLELSEAILQRDVAVVTDILKRVGSSALKKRDRDHWVPLHYAIWCLAKTAGLCSTSDSPQQKYIVSSRNIVDIIIQASNKNHLQLSNISGVTALHLASWYGFDDVVSILIDSGCDVNAIADDSYKIRWTTVRDSALKTLFTRECDLYKSDSFCIGSDVTAVYLAARAGHSEIVELLARAGANVNATKAFAYHSGITALHAAAARGNHATVDILLKHGADATMRASDGGTALHCAAEFGHPDVVKLLVVHAKNGQKFTNAGKQCVEADMITPLHLAVTNGDERIVETLLAHGANIDAQASDGFTPIHLAAQNGAVAITRLLIRGGCRLDKRASLDGCTELTPLHLAVRVGNLELVDTLVEGGCDIHARANVSDVAGVGMLHLAAVCNHEQIVSRLIKLGCNVNKKTSGGSTALFLAVKEGNAGVVKIFLESGCDLSLPQSPLSAGILHMAVLSDSEPTVRLLIKGGANVNDPTKSEENGDITPLYLAVDNNKYTIAKTLLELGAMPNFVLKDGFIVLHTAAELGYTDLVELLVKNKSDLDKEATFGELSRVTPIHLAVMNQHIEIVTLLAKAGANINASKTYCGKGGFTPLYISIKNNSITMVRQLISCGCDVNVCREDGWTTLHAAAEQGYSDIVIELLAAKANPSAIASFDENERVIPLHQAAQEGHADIVRILVEGGASVNAGKIWRNESGVTPLHLASEAGHVNVVRELLKLNAKSNCRKSNGWTSLHWAAQNNYPEIAKLLLSSGCDPRTTASFDEHKDCLALHQAAQHGHTAVVKLLLKAAKNTINIPKSQGQNYGITSLHLAAALGHQDTVKLLLGCGADVKTTTNYGFTSLHFASQNGHVDVVRTLLAARCDMAKEASADGSTGVLALHQAAQGGHAPVVKFLVTAGTLVDAPKSHQDRSGITSLHLAAENGCDRAVKALIELGADKDAADSAGFTAVHMAAREGHRSTLEMLVKYGATLRCTATHVGGGLEQVTPLHLAAQYGHRKVAAVLIQKGCDVNIGQTSGGMSGVTALHLASAEGHAGLVRMLVKAGCDPCLVTSTGKTALDMGLENEFRDVARVLRKITV